jgi:hypothetical protein
MAASLNNATIEAVDESGPADETGETSSHTMSPPNATSVDQDEVDKQIIDVALT